MSRAVVASGSSSSGATAPRWHLGPRGAIFLGIWVVGLLTAGLFNGVEVSETSQRLYNDGMRKAELMRDYDLEQDTVKAQYEYQASRTWAWWLGFDPKQGKEVDRRWCAGAVGSCNLLKCCRLVGGDASGRFLLVVSSQQGLTGTNWYSTYMCMSVPLITA
jgi:hypothetical protein